jgi:hypothetical protein
MAIQIELFWAITFLIILNTIIDHLFNWWFREWSDEAVIIPILFYILKITILLGILEGLLN